MEGASAKKSTDAAALTDRGRVRRSNEDSFALDESTGLYVVCDGMGGAAGGEVASELAANIFMKTAREMLQHGAAATAALDRGLQAANESVFAKASLNGRLRGMGSTLVAAHLSAQTLTVVNVGDSRAYVLASGVLEQITRDHSYVAEQVRSGMMTPLQAERSSLQSVITRAVGTDPQVTGDVYQRQIAAGDTVLLTSDGLTRHLGEADLSAILAQAAPVSVLCERLIASANERGGGDNITCIVLRDAADS